MVSAQIIEFADEAIKAICVANWDSDGDGELSEVEAAVVTSLGQVFRRQKSICTFNELRFFTGLSSIDDEAFWQSSLTEVTLPSSVSMIGERAFAETMLGPVVVVPGTVKTVGAYAFSNCGKMRHVIIEDGVEQIQTEAFTGVIHSMVLPSSIVYFAPEAVIPYTTFGLEARGYVFHLMVRSDVPLSVEPAAFRELFGDGVLVVPYGATSAYSSARRWTDFYKILEFGDVNRDGRLNITDVTLLIAYIGGREHTDMDALIADINGDGVLDGEDVSQLCQYLLGS